MSCKICSNCNKNKLISEFSKNNNICKGCINKLRASEYYYKNRNNSKFKKKRLNYRIKIKQKRKEQDKQRYLLNREKYLLNAKQYALKHKKQRNKQRQNKLKININYKLSQNLRCRIWLALKYNWKNGKTIDLLGCTIDELKIYLENQFKPGMSWDNYGLYGWHIDHIKPCAKFDLLDPKQQKDCFNYKNLQPLWAEENLRKSAQF